MNKKISTDERLFMALVGPSGCGKSELIVDFFDKKVFVPTFDKIYLFYQHYQPILFEKLKSVIQQSILYNSIDLNFVQGCDFDLIQDLPKTTRKTLLIFDDSCEEISRSKQFEKIATAGRHRGLCVIYIKHNLFHKSPLGRDIELQNTHIVLFKSPRDVQQIKILSKQLGLVGELENWYKKATNKPYGHLLIDLSTNTPDYLRYSSGFDPTTFYLPKNSSRTTVVNDEPTKLLYSKGLEPLFSSPARVDDCEWSH